MDQERLIVSLEARVADFEKKFAAAERKATKNYRGMRRESRSATRQMETDMVRSTTRINQALAATGGQIGAFAKAFKGGIAGAIVGVGVQGGIRAIGDIARGMADVSREAKRAGVDVQAFQELGYVAEQNRIPVDALTDGLKELSIRGDEFATTLKGPAAEAFGRLGLSAEDVSSKLSKPSDLLVEIIGRLEKVDKASQIRIADELFGGTAGERFVELLDQGADSIRDTIQEARDLGVVLDKDMLAKAEEIDREFAKISATVGTALKGSIIDAASALKTFMDGFKELDKRQDRTLQSFMSEIYQERADLGEQMSALRQSIADDENSAFAGLKTMAISNAKGRLAELEALDKQLVQRAMKIREVLDRRQGYSPDFEWTPEFGTTTTTPARPDAGSLATSRTPRRRSSRGSSRNSAIEAAKREQEAVRDLIAELEREYSLIGASDQARRASEASRKAGSAATDEQRSKIVALTEAIHMETQAENERTRVQEENTRFQRDTIQGFASEIKDSLVDGSVSWKTFGDAAVNALDRIADKLLDDTFDIVFGGKSSGGILSSIGGLLGIGGSGPQLSTGFDPFGPSGPAFFEKGGYTGNGATNAIAGMVHGQEFVSHAAATRKYRPELEAMNRGSYVPKSVPAKTGGGGGTQDVRVMVDVRVDQDGNVRAIAQQEAVKITKANNDTNVGRIAMGAVREHNKIESFS